jgi:8-amino-3,8-dideoxy-alpha-D-manno-octulosonate transaminase
MSLAQSLAIDGGPRARSRPDLERVMRLGALAIDDAEHNAVNGVLTKGVLYRYHGDAVSTFESAFGAWLRDGAVRCLAVNSGSSALFLAFAALDLQPGDDVLIPTSGFVSAATAIIAAGGVPRFVPVDASLAMVPEAAAARATARTRALLAVHPYGSACDVAPLREVASSFGGVMIEDAAQACGAEYGGRPVGTFGEIACFSFQYFKLVTTGEGGMVVTPDERLFDSINFMHDAAALWTQPERSARVTSVAFPPLNLRMGEIEGALGSVQLAKAPDLIMRCRANQGALRKTVEPFDSVKLRPHAAPEGDTGTSLIFYVRNQEFATWVADALRAEGVGAARLRGEAGMNRHWAVDWLPILRKTGLARDIELPTMIGPSALDDGVIVPIDARWSEEDVAETTTALEKVLSLS